jgi:competence protein ComEC
MGWGLSVDLAVAHTVSSWPEATLATPPFPPWGLVMLSLGLAWCGLWRTRVCLAGVPMVALGLCSFAFVRPPDILASADGRALAVELPAGMFVQTRAGASHFTLDAWQTLWRADAPQHLPSEAAGCTGDVCVLRPRADGPVVQLLVGGAPDCAAALLISLEPIRACRGTPRIDRFSVWRDGAHAAWLEPGGVRILSDRQMRGERPWVPPFRARAHARGASEDPPAEVEKPPPE